MNRPRRAFWALIAVAIIAAIGYRFHVFRQAPPKPVPELAFVTGGSEPYWQLTVKGAQAAAKDKGIKVRIVMPSENDNLESQMEIFDRLDVDKFGGIALSPIDAEGQTRFINGLVTRGKKVVTFDSDAPLSNRQSYVGTSNVFAGASCAKLVNEALPTGGKVVVLLANMTKENMRGRKQGFEEQISQFRKEGADNAPSKFNVVGYLVDNGNMERCARNIRDTLTKQPDVACFVGMNARHGPTLLKVLGELKKLDQVKLVTFDDATETLDGIEKGHIFATMAQDPYKYGYESVTSLASLCRGDEASIPIVGRGATYVNAEPIRKDNLEQYRARIKSREKPEPAKAG
jgi:ribose transport system substrate-binding protein